MCGIAGIVHLARPGSPDPARVAAMSARLAHRGPDGSGVLVHGRAGLGHRRLSIIDLSTGGQPMESASGGTAVAFNGEIFNFRPLRRALLADGAALRTTSDTECLLELYEREGIGFLDRLNGMFAFALHDRRRDLVHLARDRFGVKPLFWTLDEGRLLFASELKALLPALSRPPEVDPDALACYLRFGYAAAPATIFRGIRKLLPGHRLEAGPAGVREAAWYRPVRPAGPLTGGRLLALLEDAVRLRLVADVPVGAFLSGGVDSATVVALMSRALARRGARPMTFTVGFSVAAYDESTAAAETAAAFGADHTRHEATLEGLDDLDRLAPFFDEPFADPSAIPTWHVCRSARERVKVALSGDGADELFAGYERYLFAALAAWCRRFPGRAALSLAERALRRLAGRFGGTFPLRRALRFLSEAGRPGDPYPGAVEYFTAAECAPLAARPPAPYAALERRFASAEEYLGAVLEEDFAWYLPNDILVKLDRASMAAGLEARTPFLDVRVVEFARALPAALRFRRFTPKAFLKRALAALLPPAILHRPKRGFEIPLREWIAGPWHDRARETLLAEGSLSIAALGRPLVERILAEHRALARNHAYRIYNLLALEAWRRSVRELGGRG